MPNVRISNFTKDDTLLLGFSLFFCFYCKKKNTPKHIQFIHIHSNIINSKTTSFPINVINHFCYCCLFSTSLFPTNTFSLCLCLSILYKYTLTHTHLQIYSIVHCDFVKVHSVFK